MPGIAISSNLSDYWVPAFAGDDQFVNGELMPRHLKRGMDAGAIKAADAKVRETVEDILAQVDERKDAAIRDLSKKFDKWAPKDFHLYAAGDRARHRASAQARS